MEVLKKILNPRVPAADVLNIIRKMNIIKSQKALLSGESALQMILPVLTLTNWPWLLYIACRKAHGNQSSVFYHRSLGL
jgi:hypothetical protein